MNNSDLESEAREVALMIHYDFTLQIGEPISHAHDVEWLSCMEAHIAQALAAAHARGRAEGLEAAAQVALSLSWYSGFEIEAAILALKDKP